jgi:hypothetical protein
MDMLTSPSWLLDPLAPARGVGLIDLPAYWPAGNKKDGSQMAAVLVRRGSREGEPDRCGSREGELDRFG